MSDLLPDGFADLEPYLGWAQPTEFGRNRKRWTSTIEESQVFYDAMMARADAALTYLDDFPLDALDSRQTNLLNMCLGLVECSISIEMYEQAQPKYVFPIERFVPVHDNWAIADSMGARP